MQSTIRAAELESIKRRALIGKMVLGSEDDDSSRQAERHERSQQRAAKWPNTLQATRKKKEDARKERLAREEAARVEIDKQEERRRNRKRLEAIKRANQALLSQTDKMKMLKSQKMMSDVNEVRKVQIHQRQHRHSRTREQEEHWHSELMQQISEAEQKEVAERERRAKKALEIAREQRQQLDEFTDRYIAGLEQEQKEGEQIAEKDRQDAAVDRKKQEDRKRQALRVNKEMMQTNDHLKALRLGEEKQLQRELQEIQRQADLREERQARRDAFIRSKREEAEARAARLREIVGEDYSRRQQGEAKRVEKQVADADAKLAAELAEKERRQKEVEAAVHQSRQTQLQRKQEQKRREREEQERLGQHWQQMQAEMEAEEAEERRMRLARNKKVAQEQLRQAEERRQRQEAARRAQLEAERVAIGNAGFGDHEFEVAAEEFLQNERAKGHNLRGVNRALAKTKTEGLLAANAVM